MSAGSRVSILFVAMITYKGHGTLVTTLKANYHSTAFSKLNDAYLNHTTPPLFHIVLLNQYKHLQCGQTAGH